MKLKTKEEVLAVAKIAGVSMRLIKKKDISFNRDSITEGGVVVIQRRGERHKLHDNSRRNALSRISEHEAHIWSKHTPVPIEGKWMFYRCSKFAKGFYGHDDLWTAAFMALLAFIEDVPPKEKK